MTNTIKTGDKVEAGKTEQDHDTGRVVEVDGDRVTVAWDGSLETTTQDASLLTVID
jgi:hypothetical protein